MKLIDISSLKPSGGSTARFQGFRYEANVSFFVVRSPKGKGADKHRHPYEETFIVLEGKIEAIVDGNTMIIDGGNIMIIPPNTWHEFKNCSDDPLLMVTIHPVPKMIQEEAK
jgi:quercetin dioxygenase-like cupin family protein